MARISNARVRAPDDVRRSGARGTTETPSAEDIQERARRLVATADRPAVDAPARTRGWRRILDDRPLRQGWLAAWIVVVEVAALLAVAGAGLAAAALLGLAAIGTCLVWPRSADQRAALLVAIVCVVLAVVIVHALGSHDPFVGAAALGGLLVGAALLGFASTRSLDALRLQHAKAQATRQRAELRLRCARNRAEDFLASVDDVHWETDAALRVRFIGPALKAMTGHTPKLLLGATPVEIAERHFGRYGRFGAAEARMRERRPIAHLRVAWNDRRGRRRLAVVHGAPRYDAGGHFLGYRGVVVEPPGGAR